MTPRKPIQYLGATIKHQGGYYRAVIVLPRGRGRIRKSARSLEAIKHWVSTDAQAIIAGNDPLTPQEAAEFRAAKAACPPGMSLLETVCAAASARHAPLADKTCAEAGAEYLHTATVAGRRPATMRTIRRALRLLTPFDEQTIPEISRKDILGILRPSLSPGTRENLRSTLSAFFSWAIKAGYCSTSPLASIPKIRRDANLPQAYTAEEVKRIFETAENDPAFHRLIPYLAIGFFAGVRPGALQAMTTSAIDLPNRRILVAPHGDKARKSYYAPISDTLSAWLTAYPPAQKIAPVRTGQLRRDINKLFQAARVASIPDGDRHTYATHTYALTADAVSTARSMGHLHGNVDVLFGHYLRLATRDDAVKFHAILPLGDAKSCKKLANRPGRKKRKKT